MFFIIQVVLLIIVFIGVGYALFRSWNEYRDERKSLGGFAAEGVTGIAFVMYLIAVLQPFLQSIA